MIKKIFIVLNILFLTSLGMQQGPVSFFEPPPSKRLRLNRQGLNNKPYTILPGSIEQTSFASPLSLAVTTSRNSAEKDATCVDCKHTFSTICDLEKHKSYSADNICPLCGVKICMKPQLDRHIACHKRAESMLTVLAPVANWQVFSSVSQLKETVMALPQEESYASIAQQTNATHLATMQESGNLHDKEFLSIEEADLANGAYDGVAQSIDVGKVEAAFANKGTLNSQVESYINPLNPLQCLGCLHCFPTRYILKEHILTIHLIQHNICEDCGKYFSTKNALKTHKNNRAKHLCSICKTNYCSKDLLKYHSAVAHGNADFVCHECKVDYSSHYNLTYHKKKKHLINQVVKASKNNEPRVLHWQLGAVTRPGSQGKSGNISLALFNSWLFNENVGADEADLNNADEAKLNVQIEEYINSTNPLQCNACKKDFQVGYMLTEHIRVRHLGIPFACVNCKACFNAQAALEMHISNHICLMCGAGFCAQDFLNNHINARIACLLCDVYFCTHDSLNDHINAAHSVAEVFSITASLPEK